MLSSVTRRRTLRIAGRAAGTKYKAGAGRQEVRQLHRGWRCGLRHGLRRWRAQHGADLSEIARRYRGAEDETGELLPNVAEYFARQEAERAKAEAAGTATDAVAGEVKADGTTTATAPMEAPQPLVREIAEPEPFPMSALGPLREAAEAARDCTQCPPALAAQSTLAVASLAAQGLHDVETLSGQAVLSMFLMTVAKSGERKSSTDKLLMRPVAAFEAFLRDQYRREGSELQGRVRRVEVHP